MTLCEYELIKFLVTIVIALILIVIILCVKENFEDRGELNK